MKCVVCHGQDIRVAEVQEELKRDGDIVYVAIQVPVWRTYGERYYDRRTIRYLEELKRKLKAGAVATRPVGRVYKVDPSRE